MLEGWGVAQIAAGAALLASAGAAVGAGATYRWAKRASAARRDASDRMRGRIETAISGDIFSRPTVDPVAPRAPDDPKVLVFSNLKGGVGKTTLAGNIGAYFADAEGARPWQGKRVLFLDLDFQGSLSTTFAQLGDAKVDNRVWRIFEDPFDAEAIADAAQPVRHPRMKGCRYLDSTLVLAQLEERLKYRWALGDLSEDARFRLARFLRSAAVRARFDMVVIDCPPRTTMLSLNAYAAASHVIVPTKLDAMSALGVGTFVASLAKLRDPLWPSLEIGGIVGTMTYQEKQLTQQEEGAFSRALIEARRRWPGETPRLRTWVPSTNAIAQAAGRRFTYFEPAASYGALDGVFGRLGDDVARSLGYEPAKLRAIG